MLKRYLPLIALLVVVFACSKDKLETKPSIKIKSYNAKELPSNADFLITLEFRDKEGDLALAQLTYIRNRLNVFYPPTNDLADTARYRLPAFPKTSKGDIQLRINAGFLNERPDQNDTVSFKIFVTDLGGNSSDTVETEPLIQLDN